MSIQLQGATEKLTLGRSSTADIDYTIDYDECTLSSSVIQDSTFKVKATSSGTFTSAATGDILTAAGSNTARLVRRIAIKNDHASTSNDITLSRVTADGTFTELACTLPAGWSVRMDSAGRWIKYDDQMSIVGTVAQATTAAYGSLLVATQAKQEAGTDATSAITPSVQQYHPSSAKCWGKATVSGAVPTLAVSYNINGITDTNTDQLTVTIETDFSTANYACLVSIEAATTSLSASTTSLLAFVRNATFAAGSFVIQACEIDVGAATDPASWSWACYGDQ